MVQLWRVGSNVCLLGAVGYGLVHMEDHQEGNEMTGKTLTYWIILGVIAVLVLWDLFALTVFGPSATLSDVLKSLGFNYPILAFGAGVIVGHVLWPVLGDKW